MTKTTAREFPTIKFIMTALTYSLLVIVEMVNVCFLSFFVSFRWWNTSFRPVGIRRRSSLFSVLRTVAFICTLYVQRTSYNSFAVFQFLPIIIYVYCYRLAGDHQINTCSNVAL